MKYLLCLAVLVLCTWRTGAREIQIGDGRISFVVPDAFTALTKDEIREKYPSVHAPAFVVGNENRSVTIAYDLKAGNMPPEMMVDSELPDALEGFVAGFDRIVPGLRWIRKELVERKGKMWMYLELTSNAIDQDIHNIVLITFLDTKFLMFNFNSTKTEFRRYEKELRACAESVSLRNKEPHKAHQPKPGSNLTRTTTAIGT